MKVRLLKFWKCELAATMVEFAIFFPVMLLLLGFLLLAGHSYFAYATLATAVGGLRPGFTRGNLDNDVISAVAAFRSQAIDTEPPMELKNLLATPDKIGDAFDVRRGIYAVNLNAVYGVSTNLSRITDTSLYSMIYAINIMRQSLGSGITVPCDLRRPEPNCLTCLPVPAPLDQGNPSASFTGVECKYKPVAAFLDPAYAALAMISDVEAPDYWSNIMFRQKAVITDYTYIAP